MKKMKPPIRMTGSKPVNSNPSHDVSGAFSLLNTPVGNVWLPVRAASCMSWKTWVRMLGTTVT
jgi:hypothetical protein